MSTPREPVFTLEAFLETPDAYWERKRQQWATPSGATLENGEEVFPAREVGPLTPENRDALTQWRAAAFAHAEGKPGTAASKLKHTFTLPRVEGGLGYYLQCHCAAFAWRFIQESGATLESVASWEWGSWTMDGTLLVAPRGERPLARADGSAAVPWEEWLAERNAAGEDDNFTTLLTGLRLIAFRVAREEKATLEEEKATLEAALANTQGAGLAMMPQGWYNGTQRRATPETRGRLQKRLEAGEVELFGKAPEGWELRQNPRELLGLSVPQYRALFALCHRLGDERQEERREPDGTTIREWPESVSMTAAALYQAAGVNTRGTSGRREFFAALVDLSDREMQYEIILGRQMIVHRAPVVTFTPTFDLGGEADADSRGQALAARWGAWREERRKLGTEAAPAWDGPLPAAYVFTLARPLRLGEGALVFSRQVFARIEAAAQHLRGQAHPLDFAVFLEATITRQPQQLEVFPTTEEGAERAHSFRCYINRDQVLADHYGAEKLQKDRKRATAQYEIALEVNLAAGTFLEVKKAVATKKRGELRDIVVPSPTMLPYLANRAAGALKRAEEKAAKKARGAAKGRAKSRRHPTPGAPGGGEP
jgi:hypothetical protein